MSSSLISRYAERLSGHVEHPAAALASGGAIERFFPGMPL
jgi:hypothetical protein